MADDAFRDRRILIVEDESIIAEELEESFAEIGAVVVGPVPSIDRALELIAATPRIDAALIDVSLDGELAYPVIDALEARNVPFVLMSGYEDHVLRSRYPRARNCQKPYEFADIKRALVAALPG